MKNTAFTVAQALSEPLLKYEHMYSTISISNDWYCVVTVQDEANTIGREVEINMKLNQISSCKPRYKVTEKFIDALDSYFWPATEKGNQLVRKLNKTSYISQ